MAQATVEYEFQVNPPARLQPASFDLGRLVGMNRFFQEHCPDVPRQYLPTGDTGVVGLFGKRLVRCMGNWDN